MTLVSLANIMGTDNAFIIGERSFTWIMKSKGFKFDPWGTPFFPSLSRNFGLHSLILF
jgi:hypothetical protein